MTITTLEHGWAWRIEFAEAVTRGDVYASQFVSDDEAAQELKEKNPELGEDPDLRVLRFPSGRRERNVVRNVAAVGNASGVVEPLEATSLHLIVEQLHNLASGLIDTNHRLTPSLRTLLNTHFVGLWDDVLFGSARFREELTRHGDRHEAMRRTMRGVGGAVASAALGFRSRGSRVRIPFPAPGLPN